MYSDLPLRCACDVCCAWCSALETGEVRVGFLPSGGDHPELVARVVIGPRPMRDLEVLVDSVVVEAGTEFFMVPQCDPVAVIREWGVRLVKAVGSGWYGKVLQDLPEGWVRCPLRPEYFVGPSESEGPFLLPVVDRSVRQIRVKWPLALALAVRGTPIGVWLEGGGDVQVVSLDADGVFVVLRRLPRVYAVRWCLNRHLRFYHSQGAFVEALEAGHVLGWIDGWFDHPVDFFDPEPWVDD